MKVWRSKRSWKWIRRTTATLASLVILAFVGFEVWRQHRISASEVSVNNALYRVDQRLREYPYASFDDYRDSKITGTNGNERFVGHFLVECYNVGVEFPSDAATELHRYGTGEITAPPSDLELIDWLEMTRGIADELSALQQFDCIVLEPRDFLRHEFRSPSVSTLWFFSVVQLNALKGRVTVLLHFDRIEQAVQEYRVLVNVASKMLNWASVPDRLYSSILSAMARGAHLELAQHNLLDAADYRRIVRLDTDTDRQVADICLGHMLRLRDEGLAVVFHPDKPNRNKREAFAWMWPKNYEDWDSQELIANSVGYFYEREGLADWIDYSLECLRAVEESRSISEMPTFPIFETRLLNWHDHRARITQSAPEQQLFTFVNSFRVRELEGATPAEMQRELGQPEHLTVEWQSNACTVRYTCSEQVYELLALSHHHSSMPTEEEFYKEYPPLKLVLAD